MPATTIKLESRPQDALVSAFEAFERAEESSAPSWLKALRKGGIAHFSNLGFPTARHEEWRFTNVAPISRGAWALQAATPVISEAELNARLFPGLGGPRLVFVDGRYSAALSKPDSAGALRIGSLRAAILAGWPEAAQNLGRCARFDENAFAALNTAFADDGAILIAPEGAVVEEPVSVIYVSSGVSANVMAHPRTLVIARRGSRCKLIEHHLSLGEAAAFTNAVTEIIAEDSAVVEHCKIQEENLQSFHTATIQTQQGRASQLLSHSISFGGAVARNNIHCGLDGERLNCTLNGLYLGRGSQLVDHHTAIYHNQPNCESHEYYHGILDEKSQAVFNGKIFVRPEAQKTDAKQTNRNLLLSDDATVHTKPQLEIFADDVKCTHGATIGQLDEESIFYLRARGIGLEKARKMLLHAFASEIVNRITIDPVRESLDNRLFDLYER